MTIEFTREDDELIIANSLGRLSLIMLQRRILKSRRAINNRARKLGVKLTHQPRLRHKMHDKHPYDGQEFVCKVGESDPLLRALVKHHPEKQMEQNDGYDRKQRAAGRQQEGDHHEEDGRTFGSERADRSGTS